MTTKTISGAYPNGYSLDPNFQTLEIGPTAVIGGPGVTTAGSSPSTIDNAGSVTGITLAAGGLVTNRSGGGVNDGVFARNAAADVINDGSIGLGLDNYDPAGIHLYAGGGVTNGTGADQTAFVKYGVIIDGGPGTVVNNGVMTGETVYFPLVSPNAYNPSVILRGGGAVTNGGPADTTARLVNGVSVQGGVGTVVNFGSIGSFYVHANGIYNFTGEGVRLQGGGAVVNGGGADKGARITGQSYGVEIGGGAGSVSNFGTIETLYGDRPNYGDTLTGVLLKGGGRVTNGGAGDAGALISGEFYGVVIGGGPGKVVNYGTIAGAGGAALQFADPGGVLLDEAHAAFDGAVMGDGGALRLGAAAGDGAFTGLGSQFMDFATLAVDRSAVWSLTGSNAFGAQDHLIVAGSLTNAGVLMLGDELRVRSTGRFANAAGATLTVGRNADVSAAGTRGFGVGNAGEIDVAAGRLDVSASFEDTGGIVISAGASLLLDGRAADLAGAISGAGACVLRAGDVTLEPGFAIDTAQWSLSGGAVTLAEDVTYGGAFSIEAGAELAAGGHTLTFAAGSVANFSGAVLDGRGVIVTDGRTRLSATAVTGPIQWLNAGALTAAGELALGDSSGHRAVFENESGGVFDIVRDSGIGGGTAPGSRFDNDGILEKTGGSGASVIGVALVNRGVVEAASGTLDLANAIAGTGRLKIESGATIEAGGAVSAGQTATFTGGGTLMLDRGELFLGRLSGFGAGDAIVLADFGEGTAIGYAHGVLTATDGALVARIRLLGQYIAAGFTETATAAGAVIAYAPPAGSPADALAAPHD